MSKKADDAKQIAALPVRWDKNGNIRVLMVTSRDTGRWVMPKGWLMDGKKPWRAAEIEALEEAGAAGFISHQPIGKYRYTKRLNERKTVNCVVTVYPLVVEKLKSRWKERKQRKRHWFSPKKAAELVAEPELVEILRTLSIRSERLDTIENMRKAS